MRKSKNRYFYHIFRFPWERPWGNHAKCCMDGKRIRCLTKIVIFSYPLAFTPLLGGFPSEYHHPVWCAKTSMVWLPDGEKILKISLFVLAQIMNVTHRQTLHASNSRAYA